MRTQTTQSSWHQLSLETPLYPLQALGSEKVKGKGIGQQRLTQLLAASHLKVFQNPQAVSRAAEPPGRASPSLGELAGHEESLKNKMKGTERNWRIHAKDQEKRGWEGNLHL